MLSKSVRQKNWWMLLCAAFFILHFSFFISCRQEDDTIEIVPARHWVDKTVAVVAPLADAATKTRLERTAKWFMENFHEAQMHDTLAIRLQIEWHDELTEELTTLSTTLANRDDIVAIIGPFVNENVETFASACMKAQKPLIAPTATSEDIIRRYAVTANGLNTNDKPFLWSLTASDVQLTSLLMSDYAAICQSYTTERPNAIVFTIDNIYGKTFSDWAPFFAQDYGIEMLENQTFTTANDIYTHLYDMSDESEVGDAFDLASASFIAVEDTKMLYDIARVRRKLIVDYYGTPMFASDDPFAVENDAYWQLLNSIYRTYFAFSGLSEESLAALGPDGRKMLQGYQGFSPYADPTTGFELSYQTKFGVMPTFAECKFYDALMLASFAACSGLSSPNPTLPAPTMPPWAARLGTSPPCRSISLPWREASSTVSAVPRATSALTVTPTPLQRPPHTYTGRSWTERFCTAATLAARAARVLPMPAPRGSTSTMRSVPAMTSCNRPAKGLTNTSPILRSPASMPYWCRAATALTTTATRPTC